MNEWEDLAQWYDKKQGEEGDLWHRSLIDPAVLNLIGSVANKDILDLGCGNGYLARRFARHSARVTAIDSSLTILKLARSKDPNGELGITYHLSDAAKLDFLRDASFDIAVANMSLMNIEDAGGAIAGSCRVLRRGGRMIASISHPCFDNGASSSWIAEKVGEDLITSRRIRHYREPFEDMIDWRVRSDEIKQTRVFHRPLSWYSFAFRSAGFVITAMVEPKPNREFLEKDTQGRLIQDVPLHLVFEATKL